MGDVGGFHDGIGLVCSLLIAQISSSMFSKDLLKKSLKDGPETKQQNSQRLILANKLAKTDFL